MGLRLPEGKYHLEAFKNMVVSRELGFSVAVFVSFHCVKQSGRNCIILMVFNPNLRGELDCADKVRHLEFHLAV